MKHIIVMGTLVLIGVSVIMTGLWHQNEERKQQEYERLIALEDRQAVIPPNVSDFNPDGQDSFGLFGAQEVVYEVTFQTRWTEARHPAHYIRTAHFSAPVIWVGKSNPVFSLGKRASLGLEDMAETGRTRDLKKELEDLLEIGNLSHYEIGERVETPDSFSFEVRVSRDNPVISLVSMIAPSPDWFVAIEGLNLLEDGRWTQEKTIQTLVLDAGTENGLEFKITNEETNPQGVIAELTDIPSRSLPPFAFVEFKQKGYESN